MPRLDSLIPEESDLIYRTFGAGEGQERLGTGFMHKPGWDRHHINYHRWDPPTWSLVYVLRGRGTYALEDGPTIALEAGSCFQRRPGTSHTTTVDKSSRWTEFFIDLGPGMHALLSGVPFFFPDRNVWTIGERPSLLRSLTTFHESLKAAGEPDLPGLLCRCLSLIREMVDAAKEPDPDRDLLQEACQYLGESFQEKRTLQSFCSTHDIGYERLRKLFTARMGVPPHRYRIRRRMDRATQLLQDTNWSIGVIADDLGYATPYEFSSQFRREFRTTPTSHRRNS